MEQIFCELEQFGLTLTTPDSNNLKKEHKYIILGFDIVTTNDSKLINFSEKISSYLKNSSEKIEKLKKTKKCVTKKLEKVEKVDKTEYVNTQVNKNVNIFTYAKYLGIYKGVPKIYKHKYSNNKYSGTYSDSDSDSEPEYNNYVEFESKEKSNNQYEYEYVYSGMFFEKNDSIIIFNEDNYRSSTKLFLFEVDNSFSDINFLNLILTVMSNKKIERDRFVKVICSKKDITLELSHKKIPFGYHASLDFDKKKKYSLDEDFVFFN